MTGAQLDRFRPPPKKRLAIYEMPAASAKASHSALIDVEKANFQEDEVSLRKEQEEEEKRLEWEEDERRIWEKEIEADEDE